MLNRVRWFSVAIFVLLFLHLLAGNARAQVDRVSIVGTVTDGSAALVAAAKVTVTNLETNQTVELTTDDQGNYSAKLLHIGRYAVKVEKQGFQILR